ncbi:MAG: hypothetical protein RIQ94_1722 [Pseudomonadota bacterium]
MSGCFRLIHHGGLSSSRTGLQTPSRFGMASISLGTGAAVLSGAVSIVIEGAGIFGTIIGATGITGILMSVGILPSTPVILLILAGGFLVGCGYGSYRIFKLKQKLGATIEGEEAHFSDSEAKIIEAILKKISKKTIDAIN